jgi:AraC-like DNA-binding protein
MNAFKEYVIDVQSPFPVRVFLSDNRESHIQIPPHWHDYIEVLYMLEGTAMQQINDRHFQIEKNDIVIVNTGDIHTTQCTAGEDTRILVILFMPGLIDTSHTNLFESKYILTFLGNRNNQNYHIANTFHNSTEIFNLMMGIYSEFSRKATGYEIYIKGFIYQLIAHLLRNDMLNLYQPAMKEKELLRLDPLLKFIENHYMEDINLEKAASMLNFSYHYLSRYFKRITGKNFKEYTDFIRVREAEKLLLTNNVPVSRVALDVGFSNVSSFNRVFKRIRGYPPTSINRTKTAKK